MKTEQVAALSPDLTVRKLDHWCRRGAFGADKAHPGRGKVRDFNEHEARIATVLGAVSAALVGWAGGSGGAVSLYAHIAEEMRHGASVVDVELRPGISFTVDTRILP